MSQPTEPTDGDSHLVPGLDPRADDSATPSSSTPKSRTALSWRIPKPVVGLCAIVFVVALYMIWEGRIDDSASQSFQGTTTSTSTTLTIAPGHYAIIVRLEAPDQLRLSASAVPPVACHGMESDGSDLTVVSSFRALPELFMNGDGYGSYFYRYQIATVRISQHNPSLSCTSPGLVSYSLTSVTTPILQCASPWVTGILAVACLAGVLFRALSKKNEAQRRRSGKAIVVIVAISVVGAVVFKIWPIAVSAYMTRGASCFMLGVCAPH